MEMRSVKMPCGGEFILTLSKANVLSWPKEDREFFYAFVDAMLMYEEWARTRRNQDAAVLLARIKTLTKLSESDPRKEGDTR